MFIPVILGTARKGRESIKAAKFVIKELKDNDIKTELLDVRDYHLKATDNTLTSQKAKDYSRMIKKADALIIVSPEYNHGYPGELKMMLDLLYEDYFHKPVGVCGVSAGPFGGARMVEQLKAVLVEFHMIPVRNSVFFGNVESVFDSEGSIKDKDYYKRFKKLLDELLYYVELCYE